ncbi:hypothetical protein SLEP1_g10544 [Rubroshorea leprosula]|uniref:Uncharacterized protein n=1 Tax=Rubroshorea leprosula TaxID=152421 RepID=A0AAV5IE59_9ROSI|nr:hypothetical protein SLEP1_g10544 [Rubroshorea leprosula]
MRTQGFLAPEYVRHGELTEKSDVHPSRLWQENFVDGPFPEEYYKYINSAAGSTYRIIDPYLKGKISLECLRKFLDIAYCCIHPKASEWPSMEEVEVTLAVALELEEEADSVMEAVNPNGDWVYEVVPFCLSIGENGQVPYQEPELDSGSQWDNLSVENASFL